MATTHSNSLKNLDPYAMLGKVHSEETRIKMSESHKIYHESKAWEYDKELFNSRIYKVWSGMKSRCKNKNNPAYKNYGGRGITYGIRWEEFAEFYDDMGASYQQGLTLDRVENNGSYCKENCRWATMQEQANNTRRNRMLEWKGKKQTIPQWARELGIKRSTIAQRFYVYGWSIEKSLTA